MLVQSTPISYHIESFVKTEVVCTIELTKMTFTSLNNTFCFLGCDRVGEVPGPRLKRHAVYRVNDVVLVPLVPPHLVPGDAPLSHQLGLKPCPKHHGGKLIYHLYSCIYILTICKYTQTVVEL